MAVVQGAMADASVLGHCRDRAQRQRVFDELAARLCLFLADPTEDSQPTFRDIAPELRQHVDCVPLNMLARFACSYLYQVKNELAVQSVDRSWTEADLKVGAFAPSFSARCVYFGPLCVLRPVVCTSARCVYFGPLCVLRPVVCTSLLNSPCVHQSFIQKALSKYREALEERKHTRLDQFRSLLTGILQSLLEDAFIAYPVEDLTVAQLWAYIRDPKHTVRESIIQCFKDEFAELMKEVSVTRHHTLLLSIAPDTSSSSLLFRAGGTRLYAACLLGAGKGADSRKRSGRLP